MSKVGIKFYVSKLAFNIAKMAKEIKVLVWLNCILIIFICFEEVIIFYNVWLQCTHKSNKEVMSK